LHFTYCRINKYLFKFSQTACQKSAEAARDRGQEQRVGKVVRTDVEGEKEDSLATEQLEDAHMDIDDPKDLDWILPEPGDNEEASRKISEDRFDELSDNSEIVVLSVNVGS